MPNIADYFSANRYHAVYHLGDRVRALWNGRPVSGTVMIDRQLSEEGQPHIIVNLDLPLKVDNIWYTTITLSHKEIIGMEDSYGISGKTRAKRKTVGSN